MSDRIRFYMDEHVDLDVTKALQRRGMDVLTAQEASQRATDDAILLQTAAASGRVFVSQDKDGLRLASQGEPHTGIVYAPQGTPIGVLIRGLMLIYDVMDADEMVNHIEFI